MYYDVVEESIPQLIDDIKLGAKRTADIVKGLRNFSRTDEAEQKTVDVHEGLDSTLLLLRNQTKDVVTIVKEYSHDLPPISCYPGQLNQVFMNILSNAIQALTEKGGTNGQQGEITISTNLAEKEKMVAIRIKDNGTGIPKHVQERIFEPFFTTKDVGKGTGLGLSISYGIIEKHKGKILLDSSTGEEGKDAYTEFTLLLPTGKAWANV